MKLASPPDQPADNEKHRTCLFSGTHLDLFHDHRLSAIHAVWKGYQSVESIQDGSGRIHDAVAMHRIHRVIYDQSRVVGIWRFASAWLATEWFPRLRRAGVTHFAWVSSPAKLSQVSAELTLSLVEAHSLDIKQFQDIDSARLWLQLRLANSQPVRAGRLRAVVIEDNPLFAKLFQNLLEVLECETVTVATARAGLAMVKADPPDVIFCDIGLPGAMDGFAFARALRADDRLCGIPLIAISGYAGEDNRRRAAYAGFDRVCSKPVKFTEISEIIAAFSETGAHDARQFG